MPGQAKFARAPQAAIPRSQFDRSHGLKTCFDVMKLVPIYLDEALPGDTFNLRMSAIVRLSTPIVAPMDNFFLDTFFFAVPYRLVWANWEKFNGAQTNPGDSTSFTIPQATVPVSGYPTKTIEDHFGLPVGVARGSPAWTHSALPLRAYYRIYNDWFRDENLINSVSFSTGDGPDVIGGSGSGLLTRGKRHDYFTSCLPWPQKGTAVELPLGTQAPVTVDAGTAIGFTRSDLGGTRLLNDAGASNIQATAASGGTQAYADLSSATAATINELRQAFQIQKLYERDARGGTRYIEIIKSHFGVTSPDARLQRSEYLGGGSTPIVVTPVAQTSETGATPQGNVSSYGTGAVVGDGFVKSFTEHCILIGLASARGELTYYQGIERQFSRSTRWDFYWPALAHIGEQAVLNKEIYLQGAAADSQVFGYQERYAEYRFKPSRVTSLMRPGVGSSIAIWHAAEAFGSLPTLGQTFIQGVPDMSRITATPAEPDFIMDAYFKLVCARPMPMYSVPGLIDHF